MRIVITTNGIHCQREAILPCDVIVKRTQKDGFSQKNVKNMLVYICYKGGIELTNKMIQVIHLGIICDIYKDICLLLVFECMLTSQTL